MEGRLRHWTNWLTKHPHTLASFSGGVASGVLITIPLGWHLPDPAASMVGALIGAGAVVGGSLWGANYKQSHEEEVARKLRADNEARVAKLTAIEATQYLIPLRAEINQARTTFQNAETSFLAGTHLFMLDPLKLPSAAQFPKGVALAQLALPRALADAIAELNFFSGSYGHMVDRLRFTDDPDLQTMENFFALKLDQQLDDVQRALVRVANIVEEYVPAIGATNFCLRADLTEVGAAASEHAPEP